MRAILSFSASTLRHTQESMWEAQKRQERNQKYIKVYERKK